MAKLIKNAVISDEVVYLGLNGELHPEPTDPMNNQPQTILSDTEIEERCEQAFQKGYMSGKTEGVSIGEDNTAPLKKQLEDLLSSLNNAIAQNRLDLNSEIADILLLIIRQFFIEKLSNPHHLEQQINQILTQLNSKQSIELFLHPQDIALVQQGAIQLTTTHLQGIKIKGDEALALGGCIIKTEHGLFDASIENQIDQLKNALLKIKQRGQHAPLV